MSSDVNCGACPGPRYMTPCEVIVLDGGVPGEILISDFSLYFVVDGTAAADSTAPNMVSRISGITHSGRIPNRSREDCDVSYAVYEMRCRWFVGALIIQYSIGHLIVIS